MRQRVAIAIALLNKPELIIADEPTTALDVTIQAQIVAEVEDLCRSTGTALLWVTHDLGLVSSFADRVCVMYAGRIVEEGRVDQVLSAPRHPYTHGLLASIPSRHRRGEALFRMPDAQGPAPSPVVPSSTGVRVRRSSAKHLCRSLSLRMSDACSA